MSVNRRIKIRAPKRNLNETLDIEKSWNVLSFSIAEIMNKNASKLSFEQLYRKCYHLVLRKQGEQVYGNVREQIRGHLLKKRGELLDYIGKNGASVAEEGPKYGFSSNILARVLQEWDEYCLCMRMVSDVLMYLDRVYVKEQGLPVVYDVGISLFRDCVVQYNGSEIGTILNRILVDGISHNRKGRLVDKFLIKSVIKMYEQLADDSIEAGDYELNYYLKSFEPFFMEHSFSYYLLLSDELMKLENGKKYITRVNEIIIEEENMSSIYLPKVTVPKLVQLLDGILITNNMSKVIDFKDQSFGFWIAHDKYEELAVLHSLVSRVDGAGVLQSKLKEIITNQGQHLETSVKEAIANTRKKRQPASVKSTKENTTQFAIQWIESVLVFKQKFDVILQKGFSSNIDIQGAIESAFVQFLNKDTRVGEYLSLYIDSNIKKSSKTKTEEECEDILDKAVALFRYIKDKDLFEKYYKNHLTRRLLQQKYLSIDVERSMISRLRQELGALYTSKLEGMFRDMKASKDLSAGFSASRLQTEKPLAFSADILTTTFWPLQPNKETELVRYPAFLQLVKSLFENYYLTKHKGRNLTWAPTFGSVDIRTRYKKRIYEINMPTYAAIIMLLFQDRDSLTFEQIAAETGIPNQDLTRHLQSISVAPRTRLLKKIPMSKDIHPGDKFVINDNFESTSSKIKVLTVSMAKAETDTERKETLESVNNTRKFEIDAALVRVMKSRKTLKHNELMSEVIKQLTNRFQPSPSFIKQRIESLLEREYLARSPEDRSIYTYLA